MVSIHVIPLSITSFLHGDTCLRDTGGLSFGKSVKPLWSHAWRTSPDGLCGLMHGVRLLMACEFSCMAYVS